MPNLQKHKIELGSKEHADLRQKRAKLDGTDVASKRLFIGRLPLTVNASDLRLALGAGVCFIHWLLDRKTNLVRRRTHLFCYTHSNKHAAERALVLFLVVLV